MPGPQPPKFDDHLARRLAGRFRLLSFLWIVLSVLLLASAVGAVAAAWNFYVTAQRWRLAGLIERRSPAAVAMYQGDEGWFLTGALVNLALGGGIGAALIAYEYFMIRRPVLANRHIFDREAS
jgi:hypothetical protein